MDKVTRRKFLIASGVVSGGALAAGATRLALPQLFASAGAGTAPADAKTLVVLTLYGGNDGLNTVVPYADAAYHSARPDLAYAADKVLHLNDQLGLNPSLKGFKKLWDEKRLGVVLGVGYPKPDHSHFRSMDIWQTGSPAKPVRTGWLGRWLDGTKGTPETAVSFEPVLPPLLAGETVAGASVPVNGLKLPPGVKSDVVAALGRPSPGEPALQARAAAAMTDLLKVDRLVQEAKNVAEPPPDPGGEEDKTQGATTGGQDALGTQLDLVARCVEAGVPTRVYSVSLGGFDTHANERATQERLLGELDTAVSRFLERMARTDAGRRVVLVAYSEFGRRVRANASDGTDHGTAGPVFVAGAHVQGGLHGHQPSLTDLDAGDLKMGIDFRDVYGTLLESVLQADAARYLDGHGGRLPELFSA